MPAYISRPTKSEKWDYIISIMSIGFVAIPFLYFGLYRSNQLTILFSGILLFQLRYLYISWEVLFTRKVYDIDDNTLGLTIGGFTFKIDRQRCYLTISDGPRIVLSKDSDTGINIRIVRNDKVLMNRILKNKITLVHKKTLEESESVIKELKELFVIRDYWDVNRIKYESRQNKNR